MKTSRLFPKSSSVISQLIIGAIGAIVDTVIFSLLIEQFNFYLSFFVGIGFAIALNYILTIKYTFKSLSRFKSQKIEFSLFLAGYSLTIFVQFIIINVFVSMNYNLIVGKIVGTLLAFIVSFTIKWLFVFGIESEK